MKEAVTVLCHPSFQPITAGQVIFWKTIVAQLQRGDRLVMEVLEYLALELAEETLVRREGVFGRTLAGAASGSRASVD